MFQDGQTFGDFQILGCIGREGEAGMYRARQVSMERTVALKVLNASSAASGEAVARFRRDAKVAAALSHPDLVQVFATGETGGVHWVALEFIEGTDAQARLKRKGKLALAEAVAIGTHVAGALDYGWRKARLIHGDVEPDTILLSKKSEVKLAGLGFGHGLGELRPFVADGAQAGAAYYMSPERAEGKKDADFRADIYSLGCTLFHLIGGEPPYQGDTPLAVILHHVTMPVPDLRTLRPECPEEVARTVMKMMHKLPAGRQQSYDELIADLRLCYEAVNAPPAAKPPTLPPPAPATTPMPPRESIGMANPAKAAPSRESIASAMKQPAPAAKAKPSRDEEVKMAVMLPDEANAPAPARRRWSVKSLAIGGGVLLVAAVSLVCFRPWKKTEQLSEAQRAQLERAAHPTPAPTPKPVAPKAALKVAAAPKPPDTVPAKPAATPEPAPVPEPMPATAPVAVAVAQSVTAKWLSEQEPQWQAAFASEVSGPFEKGVAELRTQYLATVERELSALPPTAERDVVAALRAERARISGGGNVPPEDESMAPPSLRAMRANFRTAFAKLDTERFAKAKIVHARTDAILAQAQTALGQKRRTDEAQEIQTKRDALRGEWLKPPEGSAAPAMAEAAPAPPEPAPQKPAVAPPAAKLPKLAPRDLVERLLAMGAAVSIGRTGAPTPVVKMASLPGDRFTIAKVEFTPREGLSAADFDILDQLSDIEELQLTGVPVTDATLKLLRSLPALHSLSLRDLKGLTAAGYRSVAALPALKTLAVRGPITGESLGAFIANRKLESLSLDDVTFAEQDFAAIAGIPALKTLTITTRDPVPPGAWARLATAKKLATLNLEKTPKTAEMIAHIGRIATLTSLSLGGVTLPDADLAPLGALKMLGTLRTAAESTVDGSVFAAWLPSVKMKSLTLLSTNSVSDKALRGIATAFPMLEHLEVRAHADSVTLSGLAHLQKLRKLTHLNFTGDAVDPAGLGHLVTFDQITHLGLGAARLTEADVRLLAKFASLHELEWFNPPVTEVALKGYAKLRALTQFKIGNRAKPEVTDKLVAALPAVKVVP